MAYLLEVQYKENGIDKNSRVVIWSAARQEEISHLSKVNPDKDLIWTRIITDELSMEECVDLDKEYNDFHYGLPKEFRENQETIRRLKGEEDEGTI